MLDKIAAYVDAAQKSAAWQILSQHWGEVPGENQPGQSWQRVNHGGQDCHLHLPSGSLYRAEDKSWVAVKNLGAVVYGLPYYLGASFARHFGTGVYEAGKAAHGVYLNWSALRHDSEFSTVRFLKENIFGTEKEVSVLKPAMSQFYQAIWEGVPAALLYTNAFYVGTLYLALSGAYAIFNPLECRVIVERAQAALRKADVQDLPEEQIATLDVVSFADHVTSGSFSITQLLRMNNIGKHVPPVVQQPQQPSAHQVVHAKELRDDNTAE